MHPNGFLLIAPRVLYGVLFVVAMYFMVPLQGAMYSHRLWDLAVVKGLVACLL